MVNGIYTMMDVTVVSELGLLCLALWKTLTLAITLTNYQLQSLSISVELPRITVATTNQSVYTHTHTHTQRLIFCFIFVPLSLPNVLGKGVSICSFWSQGSLQPLYKLHFVVVVFAGYRALGVLIIQPSTSLRLSKIIILIGLVLMCVLLNMDHNFETIMSLFS